MNLKNNKILIPTKSGRIVEEIDNILYFQSKGNYCTIKTLDGKEIDSTKSLKLYEENFTDGCFMRVHKSYLVNFNHVIELNSKNDFHVKLNDGSCIKIAARRQSFVRKMFISRCL
jgi:two-component system, LytTR family, response regulator